MQSIFRLAWCADQVGETKLDCPPLQRMCSAPVMEMPIFNRLKRKRTDSPEPVLLADRHDVKKSRIADAEHAVASIQGRCAGFEHVGQAAAGAEVSSPMALDNISNLPQTSQLASSQVVQEDTRSDEMAPFSMDKTAGTGLLHAAKAEPDTNVSKSTKLREIVEHQVNLEILLKHRELRLIEQELAMCQTALEQLRRCELVQYPGAIGLSEDLSTGTGSALKAQPGFTQPSAPAPWGVTDGPYSRHYAKWLLPDQTFDSTPIPQFPNYNDYGFATRADGRATRNSGAGLPKASRPRADRESISGIAHQASPNQIPEVGRRKPAGPLVIKRMADNEFVKLVCTKDNRSDFSSVQGFLNHCRIAHKIDYKSHEEAAVHCGQILEDHETDLVAQAAPPVGTTTRTTIPKTPAPAPVFARVHPLNHVTAQIGKPRTPTWKVQRRALEQQPASQSTPITQPSTSSSTPESAVASFYASPLVTSVAAPYLSAQMAKRGLGGNLQAIREQARQKIDFSHDADDEEDEEEEVQFKAESASANSRTVSGAAHLDSERPQSRKGHRQPVSRPRPAPLSSCLQAQNFRSEIPESPQDTNLSPHTADSNPGLVSDHDDDPVSEPEEEARSEIAQSHPLTMTQACGGDAMDLDIEVEDDHGEHGVLIRPRSMLSHGHEELRGAGSPSRPRSRYGERAK